MRPEDDQAKRTGRLATLNELVLSLMSAFIFKIQYFIVLPLNVSHLVCVSNDV